MNKKEFFSLVDSLICGEAIKRNDWFSLLTSLDEEEKTILSATARRIADEHFGKGVFVRGLIEISSYCKNNCNYCGLRCSNKAASRYRLSKEDIMGCCHEGAALGFNTFVLQGGEDPMQNDYFITDVVAAIHKEFPDKAITLSVGERSKDAYAAFRSAGAVRYLLRHETADTSHYSYLHPASMSADNRRKSLFHLKELGYQVGSGMMIGSPGQTVDNIIDDILFLEQLQPQMIGIGPFIPATGTPFEKEPAGSVQQTLLLLSILRLRFPKALIPATTALATLLPDGIELGILSGANVTMPNLSPQSVRSKYSIYNNKKSNDSEAAEHLSLLEQRLAAIGYKIDYSRGDYSF